MARAEPSLRHRLLRWLLAPLLGLLLLDFGVSWWTALRAADLAHDRALHEIARELALHLRAGPGGARLELTDAAERLLLVHPEDQVFFRVRTRSGDPLAGDAELDAPAALAVRPGAVTFHRQRLQDEPVRVVSAWFVPDGADQGDPVLVQVAETLHQRTAVAREIVAHVLVPQLLLLVLVLAVVYFGVERGLLPLRQLRQALASRSHRDLRPLALQEAPAEVRPLLDEVNQLMERLGHALDMQNRFIADAAHQLKTPVSGLKAQIELALRESDPQRLAPTMAQLYTGVERLSRLVGQLLALARNEPGALERLRLQPLDLGALALEVSMEWAPQALRRDIDLGFEGAQRPLLVEADAERLRELLDNLIDNAVRYSREGGRVTVSVGQDGGEQVRLSVHDDGPHIPPEERTRIFERFHRLLGANTEGSGLGLAIVSEIATLHGARITLEEDSDGVGNRFSVWFPAIRVRAT
ncbi:sensor histidine kinase N-terminal domain-containing protein [Ramlibacter sp. AW1]|uniref:histidine kinase n=1 Tax=Ramlibacter aurantiacus TaxID=2801330 RepID=A0A936ZDT3_9BURK|nr:sensor histidine kinase [Ramlibacter aurantiacus]MBL0419097.1 sensor histidine kinase N-terminal domain-containing protein [Ramlibacter aurantiacus]